MQLVCATHPSFDAVARCVRCGLHLCEDCRSLDGVRNYCSRCRALTLAAAATSPAKRIEISNVAPRPTPRSPFLAASLSLVPGLGQAYAGRLLRGGAFFGSVLALREAAFASPLLIAYVYVLNLFDAWRVAQVRRDASAGKATSARVDDSIFLLLGLGVLAVSFVQLGGVVATPNRTLLPLAAIAASLVVAHETRR